MIPIIILLWLSLFLLMLEYGEIIKSITISMAIMINVHNIISNKPLKNNIITEIKKEWKDSKLYKYLLISILILITQTKLNIIIYIYILIYSSSLIYHISSPLLLNDGEYIKRVEGWVGKWSWLKNLIIIPWNNGFDAVYYIILREKKDWNLIAQSVVIYKIIGTSIYFINIIHKTSSTISKLAENDEMYKHKYKIVKPLIFIYMSFKKILIILNSKEEDEKDSNKIFKFYTINGKLKEKLGAITYIMRKLNKDNTKEILSHNIGMIKNNEFIAHNAVVPVEKIIQSDINQLWATLHQTKSLPQKIISNNYKGFIKCENEKFNILSLVKGDLIVQNGGSKNFIKLNNLESQEAKDKFIKDSLIQMTNIANNTDSILINNGKEEYFIDKQEIMKGENLNTITLAGLDPKIYILTKIILSKINNGEEEKLEYTSLLKIHEKLLEDEKDTYEKIFKDQCNIIDEIDNLILHIIK